MVIISFSCLMVNFCSSSFVLFVTMGCSLLASMEEEELSRVVVVVEVVVGSGFGGLRSIPRVVVVVVVVPNAAFNI